MANDNIQEVKDRLDVADVIARYIPIKKSGSSVKAVCPFHNEKSPSLMISPQKQIWHCFGCGEGGDLFKFIMRYDNVEFGEALRMAADWAGVQLPDYKPQNDTQKKLEEQLARINSFAASVYQKALESTSGKPARDYLQQRGLTAQTIDTWGIGFAPDSFTTLHNALKSKNVDLQQAVQAGVLGKSEKGKLYDRFRNRVMFPISDVNKRVVGFSARAMPGADTDTAKYINSPETPVYNKSRIMFGLHLAKDAIRRSGEVVVVEGQMDCIQAHQAGFTNTVATSGTALTEPQLVLLKRFAPVVIFGFDSDAAGRAATLRAVHIALRVGMQVKIVAFSGAKDPDDIICENPKTWAGLVSSSMPVIDYYLELARTEHDFGSLGQKQFISGTILPLLGFIQNPLELDHYYQKISNDFAITQSALRKVETETPAPEKVEEGAAPIQESVTPELTWEKEILGGVIMYPEFTEFVQTEGLPSSYLSSETSVYFAQALAGESLSFSPDSLVKEALFMVESSLENLQNNELALLRELKKSFYLFKLAGIKRYLQSITVAIKKAELNKNLEEAQQLNVTFSQTSALRFEIEKKLQEA